MTKIIQGQMDAKGLQIGIVVSRFNELMTKPLLEGAIDIFERMGGNADALTVAWVPGSLELPVAAMKMAQSGKMQAVICLGCIIRGSTDHYDHVAGQAAAGITRVSLDTGVPTLFGVITAQNMEQALERSGSKQGNAGAKAMLAAVEMAHVIKQL